ncbi:MAG: DNA polymerase III subunit gamma/tau [Muribaculaceae bacterium]|nr:DNA polymerase III subunit gamma/tau [Muribaculaceae bacterium]
MSDTPYIVSARKYRPSTFKSVVGQDNLTKTLKNAIDTGRLAQAYLFCGSRGVGKTSCARIFAKTINCLSPTEDGEACGVCDSCRAIDEGNSFNLIELDAASNNSVDNMRNLTDQVNIPPAVGKYRVFIIDEVHMLSSAAFNAFLKTLEEPPKYVIFILATTEKHKVIPTILSRCQIYDFKRITIQDMVSHLQYVAESEGIEADTASLNVIARKADGAMRDALSIFDQVAASSMGHITYEKTLSSLNVLDYEYYFKLIDAFIEGNVPEALMLYKAIRDNGFDTLFFLNGLASHIRDLMVAYSPKTVSLLEVADDISRRYIEQARRLPVDWLYAALKILNDCDYKYRTASNKQILAELTLVRLSQLLNPPTPPFDRVDSDVIPLRGIATPPQQKKTAAQSVQHEHTVKPAVQPDMKPDDNRAEVSGSEENHNPDPTQVVDTEIQGVTRKRTSKLREGATTRSSVSSIRLSDIDNTDAEDSELTLKREPVTLDRFKEVWQQFIGQNPQQQILISAMRKSEPIPDGDENFKVIVDHPAERQAFENAMQQMLSFFRPLLNNDYITITAIVDTSKEVTKQLPPHELLQDMISKNEALAEFLSGADMEIV